jgi:hypothetical protein
MFRWTGFHDIHDTFNTRMRVRDPPPFADDPRYTEVVDAVAAARAAGAIEPMEYLHIEYSDDDDEEEEDAKEEVKVPPPPAVPPRFTMGELGTLDMSVALPTTEAYRPLLAVQQGHFIRFHPRAWHHCRMGVIRFDNVLHLKRALDLLRRCNELRKLQVTLRKHVQPNKHSRDAFSWAFEDTRVFRTDAVVDSEPGSGDSDVCGFYLDTQTCDLTSEIPCCIDITTWMNYCDHPDVEELIARGVLDRTEEGVVYHSIYGGINGDYRSRANVYADKKTGGLYMPNVITYEYHSDIQHSIILWTDLMQQMYPYTRVDMFTFLLGGTKSHHNGSVRRFLRNFSMLDVNILKIIKSF